MRAVTRCFVFPALLAFAGSCGRVSPAFTRLMEANQLASELLVRFTKTEDAGNRAVMADTDEDSIAFAREAETETRAVQKDADQLAQIARSLHYSEETNLLTEFDAAFAKYRDLDHEVLGLAVENTNLKAQRLSFGPANDAVDAFERALDPLVQSDAHKGLWHVRGLVLSAVLALREVQVFEAPHIAAPQDTTMTELETRMNASEQKARDSLHELAGVAGTAAQPALDAANAALDHFVQLNAQVVALSRRNSDVRSLALSLGQKRTVSVECEAKLHALREHIGQRKFAATR